MVSRCERLINVVNLNGLKAQMSGPSQKAMEREQGLYCYPVMGKWSQGHRSRRIERI